MLPGVQAEGKHAKETGALSSGDYVFPVIQIPFKDNRWKENSNSVSRALGHIHKYNVWQRPGVER